MRLNLLTPLMMLFFSAAQAAPANFLYTTADALPSQQALLSRPDIAGVQLVYDWKSLESAKDRYDFSAIRRDLTLAQRLNKKLFIQIQDRFFTPEARNVPAYLLHDPLYGGGLAAQVDNPGEGQAKSSGWVATQWNTAVRQRYQALLSALAKEFDGEVYGINLPETAIDIAEKPLPSGYSCDAYFQAEMENLAAARDAFKKSIVVQYVNFWPCEWNNDHRYMARLFEYAHEHGIGLGGPDVIPGRQAQMKNAYPFFHRYKDKLPLVAMAVQEPTLTYKNPKTGRPFTREEFTRFATDYLGADIIFWSASTPWLAADRSPQDIKK
ncbi:hypothetical protein ACMGGS_01590 [Superficieibacter sp. BNK-5]|uniref:hypothetical protein n=1 Tax=Superficieibacter sp. BNK-5 TaxID=3376142 RepID=UPI0039BFE216